jgi:hypothetical protein
MCKINDVVDNLILVVYGEEQIFSLYLFILAPVLFSREWKCIEGSKMITCTDCKHIKLLCEIYISFLVNLKLFFSILFRTLLLLFFQNYLESFFYLL